MSIVSPMRKRGAVLESNRRHPSHSVRRPNSRRVPRLRFGLTIGMSLLEVVLALAILGVSLAVIGQLIRMGTTSGEKARNDTEAQLIAESLINEIAAGAQPPDPVVESPVDELGEWLYSVETQPIDEAGLLAVRVSVRRADEIETPGSIRPQFSFTRWIVDPGVELAARDAEAEMQAQAEARKSAQASGTESGDAAGSSNSSGAGGSNQGGGDPMSPGVTPMPAGNQVPPGFNPGAGRGGGNGNGQNEGGPNRGGRNGGGRGGRGGGP